MSLLPKGMNHIFALAFYLPPCREGASQPLFIIYAFYLPKYYLTYSLTCNSVYLRHLYHLYHFISFDTSATSVISSVSSL